MYLLQINFNTKSVETSMINNENKEYLRVLHITVAVKF